MSPLFNYSSAGVVLTYLAAMTLLSASRAQQENLIACSVIDDPEFDFQAIVQEGFEIRWAMDTTADTISFEVFNAAESWTSIGFSENGEMVGSDAVIGLPMNNSVSEYNLTGQALDLVVPFDDQEITNTSIQSTDGTTITFTRPLTPANSNKQTLSSTPGNTSWFIWAFGEDNELAYHTPTNRDSFVLDLFCGETASTETTLAPSIIPTSSPTAEDIQTAPEVTPTATPTPIPASEAVITLAPDENVMANPTASPTSAPSSPNDGNRAGGVHGSFRVGGSGGGWWVTASTGLAALLGATMALSW